MIGKINFVYVHLKAAVPSLVSIHCTAHKLELGFQDTIKDIKLFEDADEVIWKYYKYSCKAVREIRELVDIMGERA